LNFAHEIADVVSAVAALHFRFDCFDLSKEVVPMCWT